MAYTKLTDFAVKDALLTGNPAKVVRGTEIDAELNAIAAADALNLSAASIVAATSKATPIDADLIPLIDSAASNVLKKLTWANLKATLLTWLQGTVLPSPGPIGSTTPSTGAFTTLSASGDITSSSTSGRLTFSNAGTSGNAGVQNNNGSAYALVYPSTHSTKPAHSDISSTTRVALQNAGSDIAVATSAGLAVTGALSATGNIGTTSTQVAINNVNANLRFENGSAVRTGYIQSRAASFDIWNDQSTPMVFGTANTERMRIDSAGNLGLGVTPSTWSGYNKAFQGQGWAIASPGNDSMDLLCNAYYNGGYKYTGSYGAMAYLMRTSGHAWFTAPSGTAGNPISFTQAMMLDASGNLGVGLTPIASTAKIQSKEATASGIGGISSFAGFQANAAGHFTKLTLGTDTGSGLAGVAAKATTYGAGGAYPNNVGSLIGFAQKLGSTITCFETQAGSSFALEGATLSTGVGIAFPATQVASSNANTLDDYEEGTFTPTITFGGASVGMTYSLQMGRYTKIGNRVHYSLFVALSAKGSSTGALKVGGLPLTSYATSNTYSVPSVRGAAGAASLTGYLQGHVDVNATTLTLEKFTAGAASAITDVDTTATTSFIISGTYEAA